MKLFKQLNWEYIGLLILAFFPIYPFFLVSIAIVLYVFLSLIHRFKNKKVTNDYVFNRSFFSIQIAFFILLILISGIKDGFSTTFKYIEPSLSLLIFPIIWFVSRTKINAIEKKNILKIFIISSLLLGIYITFFSIYFAFKNNTFFKLLDKEIPFFDIHPNYVGLFFFISLIYLIIEYNPDKKYLKNSKYILITFFIWLIFFMASRSIIISFILFFIIEFFFRKKLLFKQKTILFLGALLLILAAGFFIKPFQKKVIEISSSQQFELPNKKWPTSSQIRLGLYHCALPVLKTNWITGKGIISFERELNNCYSKFNNYEKIKYNSHNYYFFLWGSGGALCLLLFLLMLYKHFKTSLQQHNFLYFYFLVAIVISLLTENILSRIYGVVFMLFFMTIFVKNSTILNEKK